jgi:hypothetical protein
VEEHKRGGHLKNVKCPLLPDLWLLVEVKLHTIRQHSNTL